MRTLLEGRNAVIHIAASTLLGREAALADVGNAAVFAASDWTASMSDTKLNISCGSSVD